MLTKIHNKIYTIEKIFLISAVLSISVLLIFQTLHTWDGAISSYVHKSLFAREDYVTKPIFSAGKITLSFYAVKNVTRPLSLLVNGEVYGHLDESQIEIVVRNHDVISIEGVPDSQHPLQLQITSSTKNISFPQANSRFSLARNTDQLFTVIFY